MVRSQALRDHVAGGILDVAARVLAERGESASMTDIADAAGVARATLYRYYPNKEALVRGLFSAALADLSERLTDARLEEAPLPEAIARVTRSAVTAMSKFRALGMLAKTPVEADAAEQNFAGPVRAVFERGAAAGAFRADLPIELIMEIYFGLLEGAVVRVTHGRLGVEQASSAITAIFLTGALAVVREQS
jgi:TetR/AcrR family transcriptional repressor of mexCD-oprJ operon